MVKVSATLLTVFMVFALEGCAWIRSLGQDTEVRVTTAAGVKGCAAAGSTRVSVFDRAGEMPRSDAELAAALDTLARNSALQLGGNAIVPVSEVVDGSQTFAVYRCQR